jgi:hypothetical protein
MSMSVSLSTRPFALAATYSRPVGGKKLIEAAEAFVAYGFRNNACLYRIIISYKKEAADTCPDIFLLMGIISEKQLRVGYITLSIAAASV